MHLDQRKFNTICRGLQSWGNYAAKNNTAADLILLILLSLDILQRTSISDAVAQFTDSLKTEDQEVG